MTVRRWLLVLGLMGVVATAVLLVTPVANEYSDRGGRSDATVDCGSVVFPAEISDPGDLEDCREHRRTRGMIATGVAGLTASMVVGVLWAGRRSI